MKELFLALTAQIASLQASYDADVKAAYDLGLKDGIATVSVPGDKVFSQADMDAALLPLNAKIDELNVLVAGFDVKVSDAVSKVKAELLAAYEASQVAESVVETGFKDLLK